MKSATIRQLFHRLPGVERSGDADRVVSSLALDSRRVTPGALFFAVRGERTDGNEYIHEAIDRGAVGIVSELPGRAIGRAAHLQVRDLRGAMAVVASRFYGHPEAALDLIGVTGTNGKTTVTCLVRHLLQRPQDPVGLLGTVEYAVGNRTLPAYRTTPECLDIYGLLSQMRSAGCSRVVMEVSSHALIQHRTEGLSWDVAAFLNLTQDHLDYHGSMEAYFDAKARLFADDKGAGGPRVAVINGDDPYGRGLLERLSPDQETIIFGESAKADLRASDLQLAADGTTFRLHWQGDEWPVRSPLLGRYNVSNLLAAFAIGLSAGESIETMRQQIASFPGVPGRMERVMAGQPFPVLVDYAHTDDALRNALTMLRPIVTGKLHVIFGCGGNRDRGKRPLMVRVAQELADMVWATSDNPRREPLDEIFEDMRKGIIDPSRIVFLADRRRAISRAIASAQPGDCVIVAGKGHETYQEFADSIVPFDDRMVARELLSRHYHCNDLSLT